MNLKVHFLLTMISLVFFGFSVSSPEVLQELQSEEKTCKMFKGQIDCVSGHADYEINQAEVAYTLN